MGGGGSDVRGTLVFKKPDALFGHFGGLLVPEKLWNVGCHLTRFISHKA